MASAAAAALKASTATTTATLRRSVAPSPSRPAVAAAAVRPSIKPASVSSRASSSVRVSAVKEPSVDYDALAETLDRASPLEIVDRALEQFGDGIAIAFSGAEDVALIEYAHLTGRPFRVFSLDTGRLNPETYRLFDAVEKHYGIKIEYTFPDAEETMALVREKGMFSFYEDGHTECCRVRKVKPLRRQLKTLRAWMTGQRKDQSPGTRQAVPVVQVDPVFEGASGGPGSLVKFNPLSNVTSAEVWHFLRVMGVPVNELHSQGYVSIGCEPCTRAVLPNQHEREGRWWWEDAKAKECGLHSGNVVASAAEQAAAEKAKADARDLWADASSAVERLTRAQLEKAAGSSSSSDDEEKATLVALYAPWCQYSQAMEEAYEQLAARYANHPSVRVAAFRADEAEHRPFAEQELGLKTFPTVVMLPRRGKKAVKYDSEARDVESLEMFLRALGTTSE